MPDSTNPRAAATVVSVGELNRLAKEVLEQNLPLMWVAGEISNFKRYDSGHCYFTLKDAVAQVDCVMFRHKVQYLDWSPDSGMQVELRAYPTIYEARGKFQLNVEAMRRSGAGALYAAFERLKLKLEKEGLFDSARKQPLPEFPRAIGLVTSLQAAALRDVLTTLARRMPGLPVILYPAPVQGEGAARKIADAITTAAARNECDIILVCRGGGSIEDLWAYNEEAVARAIHACTIPVVTGIGHETDFTIADFVADVRAPTPTAAAQLASPDRGELVAMLLQWHHRLARTVQRRLEDRMQRIDYLSHRLMPPGERLKNQLLHLRHLASRIHGAWQRTMDANLWRVREHSQRLVTARPRPELLARDSGDVAQRMHYAMLGRLKTAGARLAEFNAQLRQLNPDLVLERGYSITEKLDGTIVRDGGMLAVGEEIKIVFARGWAGASVRRKG